MADFDIQRGISEIANGATSVTITAGTEYTAPAGITSAFIRITGIENNSGGVEDSDFSGQPSRNNTIITNPSNLLTSITFARTATNNGPLQVYWEVIEYIGAASGDHEFIVRLEEAITFTNATDTTIDSSTFTPTTAADVVVFATGQRLGLPDARSDSGEGRYTWEYVSGSTLARGTRSNTVNGGDVSIAVVEFTGSAWTVQRIDHTFSSAATVETETITSVGATSRCFTHSQTRCTTNNNGPDGAGYEAYLTSTTEMSYLADSIDSGQAVVSWVISNSQTGTGALSVERISGSRADNAGGGTDPDTWTEAHATSASTLDIVSIMGETGQTDNTGDSHMIRVCMEPSSLTVINMYRARDEGNRDYRFEVVAWPEESGGGPTISIPVIMNQLRNQGIS